MITSINSKQVKRLLQLNKKSKERNREDIFLVEGIKMFLEAPKDRIIKVYLSEAFYNKGEFIDDLKGLSYEVIQDSIFHSISDTKTPQGILCLVKQYHYSLDDMLSVEDPHLLVIENLQDPGNLGTIIRTGEGAGVTGVIISSSSVDMYNPKTIRATMGSVYRVPFFYTDNLISLMELLKKKKIFTYAAHLEGKQFYDLEDFKKPLAFLIGNEGNGLTEELASQADKYLKIPMNGKVESLNAAIAATILMYEVYRQRR